MGNVLCGFLLFSIAVNAFLSLLLIRGLMREESDEKRAERRTENAYLSPHRKAINEWENNMKKEK